MRTRRTTTLAGALLAGALALGAAACDPVVATPPAGTATATATAPPVTTTGAPTSSTATSATATSATRTTTTAPTSTTTTTSPTTTTATTTPTTTSPSTTTTTTRTTTTTTSAPTTTTTGSVEEQAARAVFDATNSARAQAGLPALVWNDALVRSARQHDLAMAAANQLSHQLPGETSFDQRITAQGVRWTSVGENVGVTTQRSVAGAMSLHTAMINEVPPNDGHRRNKLSSSFTQVGIAVVIDAATGKLWLTEDYART